jgi:uncharacterized spore protein YtfJ
MKLNRLFELIESAREEANYRRAFGEPETIDGKTIIPVAQVTYGYGLGFGSAVEPLEAEQEARPTEETDPLDTAEGGGGGAGGQVKPLGAIVVTPDSVEFEESVDSTRVALGAFLMIAWSVYQLTKTLRTVFGNK